MSCKSELVMRPEENFLCVYMHKSFRFEYQPNMHANTYSVNQDSFPSYFNFLPEYGLVHMFVGQLH